ncbi:hypothetical protein [Streptomyces sp. H27-C3]|uniref:hypothetical protein n=1 Tax=Streptomyces sp. H27-C3 TaxID=3046305 RepID=UPI0024B9496C|nr:hypothetical protein [Streptomyces sp. H27-C3]MDJ0463125.1 hypothetical protein [Streptomyces sp. H27-C3]
MNQFWTPRRKSDFTSLNNTFRPYDEIDALAEAVGVGDGPVDRTVIHLSAFRWHFEAEGKTGWDAIKVIAGRVAERFGRKRAPEGPA